MFVVAGVTGNTGSVVARAAPCGREDGAACSFATRPKAAPWKAKGAEVFTLGSLDDSARAPTKALTGTRPRVPTLAAGHGREGLHRRAEEDGRFDRAGGRRERHRPRRVPLVDRRAARHRRRARSRRCIMRSSGSRRRRRKLTFVRAGYCPRELRERRGGDEGRASSRRSRPPILVIPTTTTK